MKVFNGYTQNIEKPFPEYLHFRCGINHLNYLLEKLGETFKLQKELLRTEMNHDEVDSNSYEDKQDGWLDYVK